MLFTAIRLSVYSSALPSRFRALDVTEFSDTIHLIPQDERPNVLPQFNARPNIFRGQSKALTRIKNQDFSSICYQFAVVFHTTKLFPLCSVLFIPITFNAFRYCASILVLSNCCERLQSTVSEPQPSELSSQIAVRDCSQLSVSLNHRSCPVKLLQEICTTSSYEDSFKQS